MNFYDILLAKKLSGGGGGDITTEALNVTANGQYTAPQGKAYTPVNVDIKGYKVGEVETPTDIASFTASDAPLKSLTASIVPVQAGRGDPSPTNVRPISGWTEEVITKCGKNWLKNVRTTTTINGITFTVNADGSVFIAGGQTASDIAILNLISDNYNYYNLTDFGLIYDTNYILNGCPSGGSSSTYRLVFRSGGQAGNKIDEGTGVSFNIASNGSTLVWMPCIIIQIGYTIPSGGLLFKPMIRLASESDATYEPYAGTTTTIPFVDGQGQSVEVFGGSVDVVNGGEQPRTLGKITFDGSSDENWVVQGTAGFYIDVSDKKAGMGNYIANNYKATNSSGWDPSTPVDSFSGHPTLARLYFRYPYEGFSADLTAWRTWLASNNVTVVYELATPTTFYTQPTSIKSLDGENNVSASTGQIEDLEYFEEL